MCENILTNSKFTVMLSDQENLTSFCLLLKLVKSVDKFSKVTVITHQPMQEQQTSATSLVKHVGLDFQTLSSITFVYPRNFLELCQYLAALGGSFEARHHPDVLAIVDLESLLENDKSILQKTKVLTLLRDVACKIKKTKCITTMKDASEAEDNFVTKLHFFADQVLNVKRSEDRENSISITMLMSADKRLHYDFDILNNETIVMKRIWQEYQTALPDL